MYKIRISGLAKEDQREAARWYNKQMKGLGSQFMNRIRERVLDLEKNPFIFQIRYSNIYTAVVRQFPFMIHYTIVKFNKTVDIIAILNTYRNPEIWKNRI